MGDVEKLEDISAKRSQLLYLVRLFDPVGQERVSSNVVKASAVQLRL